MTLIDLTALENSQIDWTHYRPDRLGEQAPVLKARKTIRAHQQAALERIRAGLATGDRGKMIMACGTGKTFTSLKIAEDRTIAGPGKRVLFMVPSLALLSQALTEWSQESETPLYSFAVCSDVHVGKQRKQSDDRVETYAHELSFPTTTAAGKLATSMAALHDEAHISVVFSTYHSIDVIHRAQKHHGMPAFDLIICDEAHRTTGAVFEGKGESQFVRRIHHDASVTGRKRLYMTATPRIYGDVSKSKAEQGDFTLCSMDDPALYGEELYVLGFSEAVSKKLLVDYKVIVLAIDEAHVSRRLQRMLADGGAGSCHREPASVHTSDDAHSPPSPNACASTDQTTTTRRAFLETPLAPTSDTRPSNTFARKPPQRIHSWIPRMISKPYTDPSSDRFMFPLSRKVIHKIHTHSGVWGGGPDRVSR